MVIKWALRQIQQYSVRLQDPVSYKRKVLGQMEHLLLDIAHMSIRRMLPNVQLNSPRANLQLVTLFALGMNSPRMVRSNIPAQAMPPN